MRRLLAAAVILSLARSSSALAFGLECPFSLGDFCKQAKTIAVLRVESVDEKKKRIVFKRVAALKGEFPVERLEQSFEVFGVYRKAPHPLDEAVAGQDVVWFADGKGGAVLVGRAWYSVYQSETGWVPLSTEISYRQAYHGAPKDLIPAVKDVLAGKEVEVIVECLLRRDGPPRTIKVKASLKRLGFDPQRDRVDE